MIIQNQREKLFARQYRLARPGFTLMEILVVVAIIVALAGVGGYFLLGQLRQSQGDIARIQAKQLANACKSYEIRHKQPVVNIDQLTDGSSGNPILEDAKAIYDPWGGKYKVENPAPGFYIVYTMDSSNMRYASND